MKTNIVQVAAGSKNINIGDGKFTVIAGPCSIENHDQFLSTANSVKSQGAALLRGGIWKLRTSPSAFQGLGSDSFDMVKKVLAETDMGLVSEIIDARQIEELDPIVSMYQVGARNMYNYALLKELGQTKKPILLKRGFSALIDEWIKAADYLIKGGNNNVILCERGIRTFENAMRYTFDINAVAYIKNYTSYPIIVDPSHAVGNRALVPAMALAAGAAGADGMIVEVHPEPEKALSDGPQSLTPEAFEKMMGNMKNMLGSLDRDMNI